MNIATRDTYKMPANVPFYQLNGLVIVSRNGRTGVSSRGNFNLCRLPTSVIF